MSDALKAQLADALRRAEDNRMLADHRLAAMEAAQRRACQSVLSGPQATVVRPLVLCLHLYGMERGARGCVYEALRAVSPEIAEYGDLHGWDAAYHHFFEDPVDERY